MQCIWIFQKKFNTSKLCIYLYEKKKSLMRNDNILRFKWYEIRRCETERQIYILIFQNIFLYAKLRIYRSCRPCCKIIKFTWSNSKVSTFILDLCYNICHEVFNWTEYEQSLMTPYCMVPLHHYPWCKQNTLNKILL